MINKDDESFDAEFNANVISQFTRYCEMLNGLNDKEITDLYNKMNEEKRELAKLIAANIT